MKAVKDEIQACFSPGRDCVQAVLDTIDGSTKTLVVAVFTLTHGELVNAIIRAILRGVKGDTQGTPIRVMTDGDQSKNRYVKAALIKLVQAGAQVRVDVEGGYMHNKYCVADRGEEGQVLLMGSYNWTKHATVSNRESLVVIRRPDVVEKFAANFDEMWKANVNKKLTLALRRGRKTLLRSSCKGG